MLYSIAKVIMFSTGDCGCVTGRVSVFSTSTIPVPASGLFIDLSGFFNPRQSRPRFRPRGLSARRSRPAEDMGFGSYFGGGLLTAVEMCEAAELGADDARRVIVQVDPEQNRRERTKHDCHSVVLQTAYLPFAGRLSAAAV